MIEVVGQFKVSIFLDDVDIPEANFHQLVVEEMVGNRLPIMKLVLEVTDDSILRDLSEGSKIRIEFGRESDSSASLPSGSVTTDMMVTRLEFTTLGDINKAIVVYGIYDAVDYLVSGVTKSHGTTDAVTAINAVLSKHFRMENDVGSSSDSSIQMQYGQSDKAFVDKTLLEAKLANSCPLLAITTDGIARLRSLKDIIKSTDWTFSSRDLPIFEDSMVDSRSGFLNYWLGYGETFNVNDLDAGSDSKVTPSVSPTIADVFNRSSSVQPRGGRCKLITSNHDKSHFTTVSSNLEKLASLSVLRFDRQVSGQFDPIRVLDVAQVIPDRTETTEAELVEGFYLVGAVRRVIQGRKMATVVSLIRESLNSMKGDFR